MAKRKQSRQPTQPPPAAAPSQQVVFSLDKLDRRNNLSLPTLSVDAVAYTTRSDPVVIFQFYAYMPDAAIEVAQDSDGP